MVKDPTQPFSIVAALQVQAVIKWASGDDHVLLQGGSTGITVDLRRLNIPLGGDVRLPEQVGDHGVLRRRISLKGTARVPTILRVLGKVKGDPDLGVIDLTQVEHVLKVVVEAAQVKQEVFPQGGIDILVLTRVLVVALLVHIEGKYLLPGQALDYL
ncbi:hypothetical protein ES703_100021 [subsurface metagenome]